MIYTSELGTPLRTYICLKCWPKLSFDWTVSPVELIRLKSGPKLNVESNWHVTPNEMLTPKWVVTQHRLSAVRVCVCQITLLIYRLRLGYVHPLHDVALHQCLPLSSVCCLPNPGCSLLLCYVVLPYSAWSPLDLFPLLGCQSVQRLVHLLSFILAIWPANFHVCFSVYSMMLVIFVIIDGILAYYQRAGQACCWRVFHSRCPSCSLLTYWSHPQRQWGVEVIKAPLTRLIAPSLGFWGISWK